MSGEMTFNCGSAISESCEGATYTIHRSTNDGINTRFKNLVGDMIEVVSVLQKYVLMMMAEGSSDYIVQGMNALKCAIQSGGRNFWKLLAALWYVARQFE